MTSSTQAIERTIGEGYKYGFVTDIESDQAPPGLPFTPAQAAPEFRLLTRGAERPDAEEITANPRAASARLRAAERINQAA